MMEVIREVFLYMVFLYLLMMVSYGNRDPVSHRLYSSLYQEFHDAAYLPEDGVTLDSVCHLIGHVNIGIISLFNGNSR